MRNPIRILSFALAFAAAAAAYGTVTLSFGTTAGGPLASLTAPAVGLTTTISVFYTSTTTISAAEVFMGYAQSTTSGTGASPVAGTALVGLSSPSGATGVSLNTIVLAGGANTAATPTGTARSYGLDIQGVLSSTSGQIPASATPAKLFDVTLTNLALTTGSTTLSFYLGAQGSLLSTGFFDNNANLTTTTGTSLIVTPQAVPEPSAMAALGLGALAVLRRRKRA